jgi:hypothetical protein
VAGALEWESARRRTDHIGESTADADLFVLTAVKPGDQYWIRTAKLRKGGELP